MSRAFVVAELLTKQWLMGVRRGWLSLMHPHVNDFEDVFRALGRLHQFVQNLRDQVLNVRQVVHKDAPKLTAAFEQLLKEVERAGGSAEHWKRSYDGDVPGGPNEYERKQGEEMLALYRKDFDSAVAGSKPQRGSHGLVRGASLTEFFDDILKLLYAEAKWLDEATKANPEEPVHADASFREFMIRGVKIVVVDPKHYGQRIRAYVDLIDKTYQDLARKGFSQVWYGVIFLMSDSYEKLSPSEQDAYAKAGYKDMEARAGTYHSGSDIIRISGPPSKSIIATIVHEMGHRYWFKGMSSGQRARFESLIEGDWSMLHTLLLNQHALGETEKQLFSQLYKRVEAGHDLSVDEKTILRNRFKELGLRAGVPLVSDYARSRPTEAFAEVFERYVSESDLSRDQVESFRSVLSNYTSLAERVVQRYLAKQALDKYRDKRTIPHDLLIPGWVPERRADTWPVS